MKNPAASLYGDLSRIDDALAPFSAPEIDERPGLRWMRQTLIERRDHVRTKIEEIERSTVTVTVAPPTPGAAMPSADTVAALLTALQDEIRDAAAALDWPDAWPEVQRDAATTLQVGAAERSSEQWSIELQRPAGPLDTQPTTPDGERLVFDAAVAELCDGLEDGRHTSLLRMVLEADLPITLTAAAVTGETRTVELTQQRAQSLILSG